MPSPRRSTQLIAVAVLLIAGCRLRSVPIPNGDIVATLTVPASDGQPFDPESLRGKPALVIFASPTCGYCAEELPNAEAAAKAQDANVVAVFVVGNAKHATTMTKSIGYTGITLVDDGSLKKRYHVQGVPHTLVLGPDGRARDAFRGAQSPTTLRDALRDAR